MSYFATKLTELIKRKSLTAADVSRASGLTEAVISRWRNGVQTYISPQDFETLCLGLTSDQHEQAELLRAHLLDECQGPGSDLLHIEIAGAGSGYALNDAPVSTPPLPPKLERAFSILREHVNDTDLRNIITSLADLLDKKTDVPNVVKPAKPAEPAPAPAKRLRAADRLTEKEKN